MPFHIKKGSAIDSSITVYYAGGNRWSDDYTARTTYDTQAAADAVAANPDGKNGGFTGATVVSE